MATTEEVEDGQPDYSQVIGEAASATQQVAAKREVEPAAPVHTHQAHPFDLDGLSNWTLHLASLHLAQLTRCSDAPGRGLLPSDRDVG